MADRATVIAEQREYNARMIAALERRDLDEMMSLVWRGPEVIFVGPQGDTARGSEEIRVVESTFLESFDSARLIIENEDYVVVGDTVVAVLTIAATLRGGGRTAELRTRLTDVRVRQDGDWVTVYNHSHALEPFD